MPYDSIKQISRSGYHNFLKDSVIHMTNIFSETEKNNLCNFKPTKSTSEYIKNLYAASQSIEPIDQIQHHDADLRWR